MTQKKKKRKRKKGIRPLKFVSPILTGPVARNTEANSIVEEATL